MSGSDKYSDRETRERADRRAKRLADREEQRAQRRAEQARRAEERADALAEKARQRRSPRSRKLERSLEDYVDDVAERWSQKAEDWLDTQSKKLFEEDGTRSNRNKKRNRNDMAGSYESDLNDYGMGDDWGTSTTTTSTYASDMSGMGEPERSDTRPGRVSRKSERRRQRYERRRERTAARKQRSRVRRERRRHRNLYRDTHNGKFLGVCAGVADYFGYEAWQTRLATLIGLFVIPQITVPAYFIAYFLLDKKPYYREVTDRYHELDGEAETVVDGDYDIPASKRGRKEPRMSNAQALRTAKAKFADIEGRVRAMESHVTSSQFELQRELRKISGDD